MKQLIFLLVVLCFLQSIVYCLDSSLVKLVDVNPKLQRYLFRGDSPVHHLSFDYNKLKTVLIDVARNNSLTLNSDFYLVDISLLKVEDILQEEAFFLSNSHLGEFIHWGLVGNPMNGSGLPEFLQAQITNTNVWDLEDQLVSRVKQLQKWVHSNTSDSQNLKSFVTKNGSEKSTIVYYIHDENGIDQTGEMSGAYYISQYNWSYVKTLMYNFNIARPMKRMANWNVNQLNWYCLYEFFYGTDGPDDCNESP